MKKIPLKGKYGKNKFALVDDEDYEILKHFGWSAFHVKRNGRMTVSGQIPLGKFVAVLRNFFESGKLVDHKNGDTLNNQKCNLRMATPTENSCNARKRFSNKGRPTTSQYKGVYYHSLSHKWRAEIAINRKTITLGGFDLETEAAKAYNEAAVEYHKEFARLNNVN